MLEFAKRNLGILDLKGKTEEAIEKIIENAVKDAEVENKVDLAILDIIENGAADSLLKSIVELHITEAASSYLPKEEAATTYATILKVDDIKYDLDGVSGKVEDLNNNKQDVIDDLADIRSKANSALLLHLDITGKLDVITDLDTIRSGAALGATALQEHQSLENYVQKEEGKSLFSGSYNDLTNTPTIPSKVSDLTNDSLFITRIEADSLVSEAPYYVKPLNGIPASDLADGVIPSLEGLATELYVNDKIVTKNIKDISLEEDENGAWNSIEDADTLAKASDVAAVIANNEKVVAASLNELNERLLAFNYKVEELTAANEALEARVAALELTNSELGQALDEMLDNNSSLDVTE